MNEEELRRLTIAVRLDLALNGLNTMPRAGGSLASRRIARILDEYIADDEIDTFLVELERAADADKEAK